VGACAGRGRWPADDREFDPCESGIENGLWKSSEDLGVARVEATLTLLVKSAAGRRMGRGWLPAAPVGSAG
jgi:hypothetical protein